MTDRLRLTGSHVTQRVHLTACLVIVAACSGGSKSSSTSSLPPHSTVPTALPTATISLTGGVGLTGAATETSARCSFPTLEGSSIAVLGQAPDSTSLARIGLRSRHVKVFLSSGSGPTYHERAFEGTGVTSFDAAQGAVVDSELTETAATPGSTKGNVGAITAIKGSVDCGDQTAGRSTVTLTGRTAEGALARATLDPVRVECDATPGGDEVVASGLVAVGATRALVSIGLTSDGAVTVDESLPTTSHRYVAPGSSTVTSTGAHVRARVVEQGTATRPHVLDLDGDLVCGRHAAG
jgi:hypothetical protein